MRPLLRTSRRDTPISVAARNTVGVVLPLALGLLSGHVQIGLGVATGALTTLFADQPGPYRLRMEHMLLIALAAGIAAFAGAALARWPLLLLLVAAVWTFGAALLVALGAHATRVGLTSIILLLIMSAEPLALAPALGAALLIFAGGALQTLLAIGAWPLNRYRPERLMLAKAFRSLAGSARGNRADALPPSLNDLQAFLFGSGRARGRAADALRVLAQSAERIRIELFALSHLGQQATTEVQRAALVAVRAAAVEVLEGIAGALESATPPRCADALERYAAAAMAFENASSGAAPLPASGCLGALGGQLRGAVRIAGGASSQGELRIALEQQVLPRALQPTNVTATLRANLRFSSPAFRHALRCAACVAGALGVAHVMALPHGYWVPMTVAIVLRPDFSSTWRVALLRVAGTLVGLLLTTLALHISGPGNVWWVVALMAVLCFAFRELAAVHYGIAVVCLTGMVVILLEFYGVPADVSAWARADGTALGSALALVAYLLWPTWERGRERTTIAHVFDAYADYLDAVLRGEAAAHYATRIAARAARSAAEASLERLSAEPASRSRLPRAALLMAQANRVVRAAMLLEAAGHGRKPLAGAELHAFAEACNAALRECGSALRETRRPRHVEALRPRQRALALSLAAVPGAQAAALSEASDQIVDAINSALHGLRHAPTRRQAPHQGAGEPATSPAHEAPAPLEDKSAGS